MTAPCVGDLYLVDCHDTQGNRVTVTCAIRSVLRMNSGGYRLTFDRPGPHQPDGLNRVDISTDANGAVKPAAHWPANTQTRRLDREP